MALGGVLFFFMSTHYKSASIISYKNKNPLLIELKYIDIPVLCFPGSELGLHEQKSLLVE